MLGVKAETSDLSLAGWRKRTHPDDWPGLIDHLEEVLRGEVETFQREVRFRHADGGWRRTARSAARPAATRRAARCGWWACTWTSTG